MNVCLSSPVVKRIALASVLFSSLTLLGCSQSMIKLGGIFPEAEPEPAPPVVEPETIPFEAETLYALLVAEMAGNRERYDIALGNYMQQAHKTRDPGVTARATHIARFLNARKPALSAALLWVEVEPSNSEARFVAATELAYSGRLLEASAQSEYLLASGSTPVFQTIAAQATGATSEQRDELITHYKQLLKQHPKNTELMVGLGLLLQQQEQLDAALKYAHKALAIDDELIAAAILEARLLQQLHRTPEALDRLAQMLNQNPDNDRLRLQYARVLATFDLKQAHQQFTLLAEQHPDDPELIFSLALVSNELGLLDEAKEHFEVLLTLNGRRSTAQYYLGRIAEKQGDLEAALENYLQVEPGPDFMPALLQTTDILVREGQLELADERLSVIRQRFSAQAEHFYLLEADVLSKYQYLTEAEQILSEGIKQFPNSVQLLYARAMLNEQLNQITLSERDLRRIIELDPANATALNALGYTLADRTNRFQEAHELISQALQLKPNDPAIIDSMGWVQYRLGRIDEALLRLRQAMKMYPDHEIAAHLGEVLWVSGQQSEARAVWAEGVRLNPQSTIIPQVIERLTGEKTPPPADKDVPAAP